MISLNSFSASKFGGRFCHSWLRGLAQASVSSASSSGVSWSEVSRGGKGRRSHSSPARGGVGGGRGGVAYSGAGQLEPRAQVRTKVRVPEMMRGQGRAVPKASFEAWMAQLG